MGRTIVIGDVHGCYFELTALLDEIGVRWDDRLVFVGDLITKGPANREVLENKDQTMARFDFFGEGLPGVDLEELKGKLIGN